MLSGFEKKSGEFIKANGLFRSKEKILLAVSGGTDSTALLYAITALRDNGVLDCKLTCAHINHQLRGRQADEDERFVIEKCSELDVPVKTKKVDVRTYASENKLSIETAARGLRIKSLLALAKAHGCGCVTTGHQKDDNAETIVQRLSRGTGFRGLSGIWPVREFEGGISFVRPFLHIRRREIIDYLHQRQVSWQVDRTNKDVSYRRNFIRHKLLPALQKGCEGDVVERLFNLSQSARRFLVLICDCADKVWPDLADFNGETVTLELQSFLNQPQGVKVELLRRGLSLLGSGEGDLTRGHYNRMLQLAERKMSGKKIELPGNFVVRLDYSKLIFERDKAVRCEIISRDNLQIEEAPAEKQIVVPGQMKFGGYLIEADILEAKDVDIEKFKADRDKFAPLDMKLSGRFTEWFDFDRISLPITVRFRRAGDKFQPLGLEGEKKVGKFLTAQKVPHSIRKRALVILDTEKAFWVWPIRISEKAKITDNTRKILQIRIIYNKPENYFQAQKKRGKI
ncbi:tRNA lysidine(34) synthetase TilS [Planctomycetota bacterium]